MCGDGKVEEAKQKLFTEETVSIEPRESILPVETRSIKVIKKKAELFISLVEEFYGSTIKDPVVGLFFRWLEYGYSNERRGTEIYE
jgi:hypothetical protein